MPTRLTVALAAGAVVAAILTTISPASAEIVYPWCAQYGGGRRGIGATSCGFATFDQCMATARGLGADCAENPAYPGPDKRAKKIRRPRHLPQ